MAKGKLPVNKLPASRGIEVGPSAHKPSKQELDERRRYMAEDALRDIERAEGHKRNPDLMADVKCLAKDKIDSLKRIK